MAPSNYVAVLLDGGFLRKVLTRGLRRFPTDSDITSVCDHVLNHRELLDASLYRVFFYDAAPFTGTLTNPLNRSSIDFSQTTQAQQNQRLLQQLERRAHFAVRRGALVFHGWRLGKQAHKSLVSGPARQVTAKDIQPHFEQKGVDMRIGLDIASLALKRLVSGVVLVTGDSDMVPAMKLARREGLKVYLYTMSSQLVRPELKVHADVLLG